MACIFQRGKTKTWWIKYYVDGQQVYHSLDTDNERVARTIKRRIEGDEAHGDLIAPSRTPLPEFLEQFCQFLSTTRTRKSYSADTSNLRVFFGPICPALALGTHVNRRFRRDDASPMADTNHADHVRVSCLEDLTAVTIETFITQRIREKNIAPKTANRYREVMHVMFNYAIRTRDFVSPDRKHPNPAAAVQRRREPSHTIRYLAIEDVNQQLEVLSPRPELRALVATYIFAGLRREEALWLTRNDVDLDRRLIRVVAKTVRGEFWQPKTKRNRAVPISRALLEVLQSHAPLKASPWLFPSPQGQRWDPDNFSQTLRKINRARGLRWGCLDYRHTFGSLLAQKGESLYKIAQLMGNSPDVCRKHYAALTPEKMHDVVEFDNAPDPDQRDELLKRVLARLDRLAPEDNDSQLRLAE